MMPMLLEFRRLITEDPPNGVSDLHFNSCPQRITIRESVLFHVFYLGDTFLQLLDALVDLSNREGNLLAVSTLFVGLAFGHIYSPAPSTNNVNEECFAEVYSDRASRAGRYQQKSSPTSISWQANREF